MSNIKQHNKPFFSEKLKKGELGHFIKKMFPCFLDELNKVKDVFYNYDETAENDMFEIIERTWLGIFNNALIRLKENKYDITTLQEFTVWKKQNNKGNYHKVSGRCDFLINLNKKFDIIVEAKRYNFTNDWKNRKSKKFFKEIKIKVEKNYYQPLKKYLTNPVGMIMVFEWVKNDRLIKAQEALDSMNENPINDTDFCSLFHNGVNGVIMYGHVFELK